jgi:hypothetical protein
MSEDLSDLELARYGAPGVSDSDLVTNLAAAVISDMGVEPPVDHNLVASWRGLDRVEEADIPWAGCLVREEGRLVAKVRASDPWGRKRFSVFHEIGHTFLPGVAYATQYRCNPQPARPGRRDDINPLEVLSDIAASELLLPRDAFLEDLSGEAPTMATVEGLAARYDASLEATAHRLVGLSDRPALLIAFEPASARSRPGQAPTLRVRWAHGNRETWPYVPPNKSAPDDSPFMDALNGSSVDHVGDLHGLTSTPLRQVRISAGLYPYYGSEGGLRQRVLALVSPAPDRGRNA